MDVRPHGCSRNGAGIAYKEIIAYICSSMAKTKTIQELRTFLRAQAEQNGSIADPDNIVLIERALRRPNPGIARAKRKGVAFTIVRGDKICRIQKGGICTEIGTVEQPDVEIGVLTITL